jgi:hypothetical protein
MELQRQERVEAGARFMILLQGKEVQAQGVQEGEAQVLIIKAGGDQRVLALRVL